LICILLQYVFLNVIVMWYYSRSLPLTSYLVKCIVRCHWWDSGSGYSSFSTCISAIHRHHRT